MLDLTDTQKSAIAATYKVVSWLFTVIDNNGVVHHWSTVAREFQNQWYSFKIDPSFNGLTLNRGKSELGIQAPNDLSFTLLNALDATRTNQSGDIRVTEDGTARITNKDIFEASDFIDGTVLIQQVINDELISSWKFRIERCEFIYQTLKFTCKDYLQKYLEGDYPNTELVDAINPSENPNMDSNVCVPIPFGKAYIPIESIVIDGARYYLLGPADKTYNIYKVHAPRGKGNSEWLASDFEFRQSTKTINGNNWQVFEAIIADSDEDGVPDCNGIWLEGKNALPILCQFDRSDTKDIVGPANVIKYILKDYGIPDDLIDTDSFDGAGVTFTNWGLSFDEGGYFYKQGRPKVLAQLLDMCHSCLQFTDKISLKVLSATSKQIVTKADVLRTSKQGPGTFRYNFITQKQSDSSYVAFSEAGKPQDKLNKALVPTKSTMDNVSQEVFEIPLVHDSQNVQRIGILRNQRRFLKKANISFTNKGGSLLAIQPDDIITINDPDYGGTYPVLVDSIRLTKDPSLSTFSCIRFSDDLDDWEDLNPGAITIVDDGTTTYWSPVIAGPSGTAPSSGEAPNALPGKLTIGVAPYTNTILLDATKPYIKLKENTVERLIIGELGSNNIGIVGKNAGGNQVFKIDSSEAIIAGWNFYEDKLSSSGITIDSANDRIRSSNYVSGSMGAGFTLEPDLLEVGNIAARGIIRTAVFQKDVISAVGGNILIRPSDVLDIDTSAADNSNTFERATSSSDIRVTEDGSIRIVPGASLTIKGTETFALGDILRIKEGTNDEWFRVEDIENAPTYLVTRDLGNDYSTDNNPIWKKGATVVDFGQAGDGGIFLTSSETNAPYLSVFTHTGNPWTNLITHARLGNLNGSYGIAEDKYGLAAGDSSLAGYYVIINGTDGTVKIRGSIDIIDGSVSGVDAANIAGWAHTTDETKIDGGKIYTRSITADKIVTGTITSNEIATKAVIAGKIATNAITASGAEIADATIITAKIANLAVTNVKIADLAIDTAKISDAAITEAKIANLAVTNAKIHDLDAAKVTTGTLNADRIAAGSITADKINVDNLSAISTTTGSITAENGSTLDIHGNLYLENDSNFYFYDNGNWEAYIGGGDTSFVFATAKSLTIDSGGELLFDNTLTPKDTYDLGTSANPWEDLHLQGDLYLHGNVHDPANVWPQGDGAYSCGTSDHRWYEVWTVNQHTGDILFSDTHCPICGRRFKKGDMLALEVIKYVKGKKGDEIDCIPVHLRCTKGIRKVAKLYSKDERTS